jgi:mannosyl-oligosaccharide alpha-1,2-mannosidase
MSIKAWNPRKAFSGKEQAAAMDDNILANLGSFSIEFTHLSHLTGDMRFYDAVQRTTNLLNEQQSKTKLPGLWPQRYDVVSNGIKQGNSFCLGEEADYTYE